MLSRPEYNTVCSGIKRSTAQILEGTCTSKEIKCLTLTVEIVDPFDIAPPVRRVLVRGHSVPAEIGE